MARKMTLTDEDRSRCIEERAIELSAKLWDREFIIDDDGEKRPGCLICTSVEINGKRVALFGGCAIRVRAKGEDFWRSHLLWKLFAQYIREGEPGKVEKIIQSAQWEKDYYLPFSEISKTIRKAIDDLTQKFQSHEKQTRRAVKREA